MRILAIDPGPEQSAVVELDCFGGGMPTLVQFGTHDNYAAKAVIATTPSNAGYTVVIEQIASYGMPVGAEVFETCVWTGRFIEAANCPIERIPRKDVKLQLCMNPRAKDGNVRQALIDRYGGPIAIKKGGPLYKVSKDVWAALAVGITYWETRKLRGVA